MPGSVGVHAAIFAAGALVGGGIAAAVANRNLQPKIQSPIANADMTGKGVGPVVVPSVLKYGNPGIAQTIFRLSSGFLTSCAGPIADPLVRKAYVASYDRRLRHPAWVSAYIIQALSKFELYLQTAEH